MCCVLCYMFPRQVELFEMASMMLFLLDAYDSTEGLVNDALDYFACLSLNDELQVAHITCPS